MSWLSSLLGRRAEPSDARILSMDAPPAAIFAIGDVHGCHEELLALEAQIIAAAEPISGPKLLIYLGDLIDRGKDSAGVLDHILSPAPCGFTRLALRGNHEEMFEAFLEAPENDAAWLAHGGRETLASYGIYAAPDGGFADLGSALSAHIPSAHLAAIKAMPSALTCGDHYFCHAGIDPARAPEAQLTRDLHWSVENAADRGWHDRCVVHGHVIVEAPEISPRRINLDTGAYLTGQLSGCGFFPGAAPRIFQTNATA